MTEKIISISTINKVKNTVISVELRKLLDVKIGEEIVWIQKNNRVTIHSYRKPTSPGIILGMSKIASSSAASVPTKVRDKLGLEIGSDIIFALDEETGDIFVQSSVLTDEIFSHKLEVALEIICQLYSHKLIGDAYIVGSVATKTAKKESDIDIVIIDPLFETVIEFFFLQIEYEEDKSHGKIYYEQEVSDLNPAVRKIVELLENIGVRSYLGEKELKPGVGPEAIIYQKYKDELIQIWGMPDVSHIKGIYNRITKDDCVL